MEKQQKLIDLKMKEKRLRAAGKDDEARQLLSGLIDSEQGTDYQSIISRISIKRNVKMLWCVLCGLDAIFMGPKCNYNLLSFVQFLMTRESLSC